MAAGAGAISNVRNAARATSADKRHDNSALQHAGGNMPCGGLWGGMTAKQRRRATIASPPLHTRHRAWRREKEKALLTPSGERAKKKKRAAGGGKPGMATKAASSIVA